MFRWIAAIIVFCPLFVGFSAASEINTEVDQLSEKEIVIQEKARKRLYPGGRDEEDLIIHPQAIVANRKLNKREIEKEVYKQLFNEDLKTGPESDSEEEPVDED